MPLSLCRRHDAEQCDEARHLPRVEGAGRARHGRPRAALQNEPRELLVGEAPEHRKVGECRRSHGKGLRERAVSTPGGAMARCALRGVQPLAFAHHRVVGAERRDIARDRPPVLRRERLLELRHRRASDPDCELPIHVHGGHGAHGRSVGEARGRRSLKPARLGAVTPARRAVARHALLLKHRRAAGERRRPLRIRIERAPRGSGDPLDQRSRPLGHGVGRCHAIDHRLQAGEVRVGHGPDGAGQRPHVQARLLQELSRL